ncbi:MAG: aminotransferase class I/II-fold pyridoxal phosphate-dependent enzyme [Lachnospiraceae bacterium]|nr:aminotransferase class I/II-fold pyridoxal phosphate-dependent enzyme [Lachnospiraceae bacterium]
MTHWIGVFVGNLYQKLLENGKSDFYPYHMPGHKRKPLTEVLKRVCDIDITEIDGFDNLHHAEGILAQLQKRAAKIYGSEECFYLVGGSTAGILSAIATVIKRGETFLIGRNCHKSVYHGAYLNGANTEYLFPESVKGVGIVGEVTAQQVQLALESNSRIKAVIIVSPTYEGVVSNVREIADIVHEYGIPLIVDEAHGAHFGFHEMWPHSACTQGADIVIQSLHKTLPSLTQTALLHVNGNLVDRSRLKRFLAIHQTSSPSYVFMAGIEESLDYMESVGKSRMDKFADLWWQMLKNLSACKVLMIYPKKMDGQDFGDAKETKEKRIKYDIGKLVISVENSNISGQKLYDILLNDYHLQMEMAGGSYVLAMFTLADEQDAYVRLTEALLEIDKKLRISVPAKAKSDVAPNREPLEKAMEFWMAWDMTTELVDVDDCDGRIAGDFINLYPPGVPVVVPGEILKEEILEIIKEYIRQGLPVHGVKCMEGKVWLEVIYGKQ